jgi:hypothetical protein
MEANGPMRSLIDSFHRTPKPARGDTLYIFRSVEDPTLCGLSIDMDGLNILPRYGSWDYLGVSIPIDHALATMVQQTASLIERNGYAIVRNARAGEIWLTSAKPDHHVSAGQTDPQSPATRIQMRRLTRMRT